MTIPYQTFSFPVFIGDIGGTNARFAYLPSPDMPLETCASEKTKDHPDFKDALRASLAAHGGETPKTAIFAVAGPVHDGRIKMTNSPWVIEPDVLMEACGFEQIILINDFEAQALSLPVLEEKDLYQIGAPKRQKDATKLVLGPGTGLGVATLAYANNTWTPLASEGGHIDFATTSDEERQIWDVLDEPHGRISGESLICGDGLERLYSALAKVGNHIDQELKAPDITQAALEEADPLCIKTVMQFCQYLGRFAGDMALVTMAKGGVYIAGGIAPRIIPLLEQSNFRQSFEAKAPHSNLLQTTATQIITHKNPALAGLANYARDPAHYALELKGKHWRKDNLL